MKVKTAGLGLHHLGLVSRSAAKADRFYRDVLGLEKSPPKTLPASLARPLFGLEKDVLVLNYAGEGLQFEVFVLEGGTPAAACPAHACLETDDLDGFLGRCRGWDVPVIRVPKGDSLVTFIRDGDGNLFEVKTAAGR
jgi:catechol 2,3-dioxygenase-like lactoylglutathione lyase family enzyme